MTDTTSGTGAGSLPDLSKAEVLIEALPYFQRYAGRTFVVKYGGHAMGDPKAARDAFEAFRQLIERFPNSKYAADASDRLKYLANAMAQYEIHVAHYYFKRGAYLAAINRAQTVLRDYAGSPFNQEALRIQIRSYDELGMQDLRDDAERVYALNYKNKSTAPLEASARKSWWKFW